MAWISYPGLNGGITIVENKQITLLRMPTITQTTKPAVTVFAKDDKGNKIVYKSGPLKGEYKRIIKTAAKTKKELDVHAIYELLAGADQLAIETPAMSFGNSAKSTASTNKNFGKLLAIAELLNVHITLIPPHVWKKALKLGRDKQEAIAMAEHILKDLPANQHSFTSAEDGLAESFLILHYNQGEPTWK